MNTNRKLWVILPIVCFLLILSVSGESLPARAQSMTPSELMQQAWHQAQSAGSYRFISNIDQTLIPRPVPEMIGQQETAISLASDGAVLLPDQAYLTMQVQSSQGSDSVTLLRDGERSYMMQDGKLKPVENSLNLATQSNDLMGYLAAADQVTLIDPPEGHPELRRYSFVVDGPRYAEYVRQQAEAALQAEPGAPQGLTVKPLPALQKLSGRGELWVNSQDLPVRQVLELELPQVNAQYSARIKMIADFSAYGKVDTLPRAVPGADGSWQLQGSLTGEAAASLGAFPGLGDPTALATATEPALPASLADRFAQLVSRLPLQVSPTAAALVVVFLITAIMIYFYRRNPRRCYALIVFALIPIMVLSPVLESAGVVRFMERQAQAAEERLAAFPEMLRGMGLEVEETETASSALDSDTPAGASKVDASPTSLTADNGLTARTSASLAPGNLPLQQNDSSGPKRCGDGDTGTDTDSDGLSDQVELCLGTSPDRADTDSDGISDQTEINGFDLNGIRWTSDPLKPDSNGDGILDTLEWPTTVGTVTTNGQAASADLDGDLTPNLWDDDDDDDGVPDQQDLSPFAVTGRYTTDVDLSTTGSGFSGYEFIEIQVQPEELEHLRYATTPLDWPEDTKGNAQDRDDSIDDLRLVPFLVVTSNVAPDQTLADKYGLRVWQNAQGKYILMASLAPVQENGAVHSFYAKLAFNPTGSPTKQIPDLQLQAQMVWMAEMKSDYSEDWVIKSRTQTLHEYQDSFRVTGLKITKDQGYEAAVFGVPESQTKVNNQARQEDDIELFRLLLGLNDTFKSYMKMDGQPSGKTALQAVTDRFANKSATVFNVGANWVSVAGPHTYGHMDEGIAGVGSDLVPGLLNNNYAYNNKRCKDAYAETNNVSCGSLIVAYESSIGVRDLSDMPADASGKADLAQLHTNLADVPLLTTRGVQMNMYEKDAGGNWQITTAARMLELIEQRYKGDYTTALRGLFPDLSVDDLRFMTYASYLWATSPSYTPIAVDGQALVGAQANETELAANWALPAEQEAAATTAVNYWAMGTGIASSLIAVANTYTGWTLNDLTGLYGDWGTKLKTTGSKTWSLVGVGMSAVVTAASTIMGIINSICGAGSDLPMCRNETALKAANIASQALSILGQAQATADLIYKYVTGALEPLSKLSTSIAFIGLVVGIATTWVGFALTMAFGGAGNPVVWRNALASAIITTIYMIIMFIINCIPVIGQVIAAIMAVLDGLFSLFTWLFGGEAQSIAQALLKVFYDAEVCTTIAGTNFGAFDSRLADSEAGLTGGNTFILSVPFEGAVNETGYGNSDDLVMSSIEGALSDYYLHYKDAETAAMFPSQDMRTEPTCTIDQTVKICSNTASAGYALTPRINGIVSVASVVDYTIVWAAFGGAGAWRYSTSTWDGILPEENGEIKPEFMYLDVLPVELTDLWSWSALTNHDPDGDGLTNEQETALGTTASKWDTDSDGVSDFYEWQNGTNPKAADTDGDGLNDGLEIRLGTFALVADSDGDGLSDGEEVGRYVSGARTGGWEVTLGGTTYWVSSDPLKADTDDDGLTDAEEKANVLSPRASNPRVPSLSLSVTPLRGVPGGRAGAYWKAGEAVTIDIRLSNGSPTPVEGTLFLDLPDYFTAVTGGTLKGDHTIGAATGHSGSIITNLDWNFNGANTLQTYESVSTTITATTTSVSASDAFRLTLPVNGVNLEKTVKVVLDNDLPEVAILAPANNAYLRGESFVVGGLAADPTTWLTGTELSIVPQGSADSFELLPTTSGPWAYTWDFPDPNRVYTLKVRATDAMGYANTSGATTVTVDNTKPSVSIASTMTGITVHLSGTATDNLAGVAWVRLSLDGQPWHTVALNGTSWTYDWEVGEGAQGDHLAAVMAVDRSGNQSDIVDRWVMVDSVAPSSIVNAGADKDVPTPVKPDASFKISGVADEGGHLPLPAAPVDLKTGMDVFDDSAIWLGIASIHDNDGGVLAAWIGDFNADRMADLAVGLPGPTGAAGQVSVLYGRAGGWPTPPNLAMLTDSASRFSGATGTRLGSLLAAAGDTNGDNFSDLLAGERNTTRAFLVFGKPGTLGAMTLDGGLAGYRALLQAPATIDGLAGAGDVDGDGYEDLLVEAGGTAYLVLGRSDPWPETIDVAAEAEATFSGVSGALGVGDVDDDQLAEWLTLASTTNTITLRHWDSTGVSTFSSNGTSPWVAALGDVNGDSIADWIYAKSTGPVLVYGTGGSTYAFNASYDGFFAAPGDVDGDGRADILLTTADGLASLLSQPAGKAAPEVFATVDGVGGTANAPYAAGADLNSDGSADLLLIPTEAEAEARGFDAPDFSSGFISPLALPLGVSSLAPSEQPVLVMSPNKPLGSRYYSALGIEGVAVQSGSSSDSLYVDDDGGCEGHSSCYTSIQAAVDKADGGGDSIIVYPGAYAAFTITSGTAHNNLTVQGVNADAVFVDGGGSGSAITVAASGVHLSNLTVRNAVIGIELQDGAGSAPSTGASATTTDHVVIHSVQKAISLNPASALNLSDSTLVGDGSSGNAPLYVNTGSSSMNSWNTDANVAAAIGKNGTLTAAGGALYAVPGSGNSTLYTATPGANGALSSWSQASFSLRHALPPVLDPSVYEGINLLAGGATDLWQLHSSIQWPGYGTVATGPTANNGGIIRAVAVSPTTGDVYVGGYFTSIGGITAQHVARWDIATSSWKKLGDPNNTNDNGVDGVVYALTFDGSGNLYIGGDFTHAGIIDAAHSVGRVVGWNGSSWFYLGTAGIFGTDIFNGVNGPVYALAYDPYHTRIYIGGSFQKSYEYGDSTGPKTGPWNYNLAAWTVGCTPYQGSHCFQDVPTLQTNGGAVTALGMSPNSSNLYLGGGFSSAGVWPNDVAGNVAILDTNWSTPNGVGTYKAVGGGIPATPADIAVTPQGRVYVAIGANLTTHGIYEWNGTTWTLLGTGTSESIVSVAADNEGTVYAGGDSGHLFVKLAFDTSLTQIGLVDTLASSGSPAIQDLAVDSTTGQLYAGFGAYKYYEYFYGDLERWTPGSLYRRNLTTNTWSRQYYPPTSSLQVAPNAMVADPSGNLYASWFDGTSMTNKFYRYNSGATPPAWEARADPTSNLYLKHFVWAGDYLYALAKDGGYTPVWSLLRYDPTANSWTPKAAPPVPNGAAGAGLSLSWDGSNYLYLLRGDGTSDFYRYSISGNTWESMPAPTASFTVSYGPAMARIGSNLFVYGTGASNNLFRYGSLPTSDLRLTVDRTVFVVPDSATSLTWTNLAAATGRQLFNADIDSSNNWVGPSGLTPGLPDGATRQTSAQAGFASPEDGLYRLGPSSTLTAGYHHYKAVAHVYPAQADCAVCNGTAIVWGRDAFATVRAAVESGAARVLVHAGRYPQTFYLVSGVEVIGSGAETTLITQPPAGTAATLVTAEGVAGASLARLTLAGGPQWSGFLAKGGTQGVKLTRLIVRDLNTGVRLKGGSQVDLVNNTITGNTNGIAIEDTSPVSVRNTILAYNSGTGLAYATTRTSLSNTYNDFWSNGTDISQNDTSLGSLLVDPRFRNRYQNDLRLRDDSPLINMGAPNDPTTPGGGERVDIGYAESNAAAFYVSSGYSEMGVNDGLTWGIDAFAGIQPALNAAVATMADLQGALPAGGYSVAVDAGTYSGPFNVPSHVRLMGSGAEVTTINAAAAGGAVVFDGVDEAELSGFTVTNTAGAGVALKNTSSGITITRALILNNTGDGISLAGSSSGEVLFNTLAGNTGAGIHTEGAGTWVNARDNILDGNTSSLQAGTSSLIHSSYNLFHDTANPSPAEAGAGSLLAAPQFAAGGHFLSPSSPAIDAAEPWLEAPPAGGLRADLGFKELIASPLVLVLGPEIDSTVTGNSGVAKVEAGLRLITDLTLPVTDTNSLPTSWDTLTASSGPALFNWTMAKDTRNAAEGLYRVYSKATDANGNAEADKADWYEGSFVLDKTAPSITWATTPAATTEAAILAAVNVTGTLTIGTVTRSDVAQVYFNVTGPDGTVSYPAEDGRAWIPLPKTGSYTIQAVAADEAGNSSTLSATVAVSGTSPVATVTNYGTTSDVSTEAITLHGYVRFASAGAGTVEVSVNSGAAVQATLETPGAQFSAWSQAVTLTAGTGHTSSVSVTPKLGGTAGTPVALSLTINSQPPSITFTTPAVGAWVNQVAQFTGTVSTNWGGTSISRVEVSVDGGYTWRQAAINTTNNTWSLSWDMGSGHDNASVLVKARAVNAVGIVANNTRLVAVDNVPPTGLTPVTFDVPAGQHLNASQSFTASWKTPADNGGTVTVYWVFNHEPTNISQDTLAPASGTSERFTLDHVGSYYLHLIARDPAGNDTVVNYGPWHARSIYDPDISQRRQSIVLDGNLDLAHNEWQASDLLGSDARSGNPQELYATWDGQYVFLGWSGAWWTLDGVLWAYLDTASGGTTTTADGSLTSTGLEADRAVQISGPADASLWTWNGTAWIETALTGSDFANGPSGDTEVRVPWTPSGAQKLNLVAFALPVEAEQQQQSQLLAPASNALMAPAPLRARAQDEPPVAPWAVFPTTNDLNESLTEEFGWADTSKVNTVNSGQPSAQTAKLTVTSPQADGTAWGQGTTLQFDLELENPDLAALTNLVIHLAAPEALAFQPQAGLTCTTGNACTLSVGTLAAGATANLSVDGKLTGSLSTLQSVTSTFTLSASNSFTPESQLEAAVTHRVDGQAPAVAIDALPGSVIPAGAVTFTGTASDAAADGGTGSGLAYVDVSLDGTTWQPAAGTQAWSATLTIPSGSTGITLRARAADHAGLTSTATHSFTVDSTVPKISWVLPVAVTAPVTVLGGTTKDPAPANALVSRVEVKVDGVWQLASGPYAPDGNGDQAWTWSWKAPVEDGKPHKVQARATDGVGLQAQTLETTVIVDGVGPQLTVVHADPLAINPADGSLLTGTASDGSGVLRIDVLVYGPAGSLPTQQATLTNGSWTFIPNTTSWTIGTYALRVQAVDIYGNVTMEGPYLYESTAVAAPVLDGISPASAKAGATNDVDMMVLGSNFTAASVVRWNGADLETTLANGTQLDAVIPAENLAAEQTAQVTVYTPAPGGGTSDARAFFVTYAETSVTDQKVDSGTDPSATSGEVTATATGSGLLAAASFAGNPGGTLDLDTGGSFSGVYAAAGNTFTAGTVKICSRTASDRLYWWKASTHEWQLSDPQSFEAGTGCITLALSGTSSPSLSQLQQGVSFAAGTLLAPKPTLSNIEPAAAKAGGASDVILTVTGSGFTSASVVRWNATGLATTYASATQLTAVIPAASLKDVATAQVTVNTPAPGGGTSAALAFFATYADTTVTEQKVASGTAPSVTSGPVSASATGEGLLAAARFTTNPGSPIDFVDGGNYSAVYAPGASLGTVTVAVCSLASPSSLYWWEAATQQWRLGSQQSYADGCITLTVTNDTSPALSQLQAAYFAVGTAPAPALTGISPAAAKVGSGDVTLTVTGSGFTCTSKVYWNETELTTAFVSVTELTAVIPAASLATVQTAQVTVQTPAPGGGTSAVLAFFVTYAETTVAEQKVASGTNPNPISGPVSAEATGEGLLAVARYAGDPGGTPSFSTPGSYFDVYTGPGSAFTEVSITLCGTGAGDKLYWWDGAKWQIAGPPSYANGCITLIVTDTSSPSLSQLQGTYFATGGKVPAVVKIESSLNPSTYGEPVTLTVVVSGEYGLPSGTVTFLDGGQALTDCGGPDLVEGQAACVVPLFVAGTHALAADYSGDPVYQIASGTLDQVVNKAIATLTIDPDSLEYAYDGTTKEAVVTTNPPGLSVVTVTYGDGTGQALPKDAGTYPVTASLLNDNYQAVAVTSSLIIHPIPLTITAKSLERKYLEENPPLVALYSGFVGDDDESVLNHPPELSTDATLDSEAGTYSITITENLSATNYVISYEPGTLTIGPTSQSITFDPLPDKTYLDEDFPVSATANSGLKVTFSVGANDACTIEGNLVHITKAGDCTVTASQDGDKNYGPATPVPQTFTIIPKPTTIELAPASLSQEYDGAEKAVVVTTHPEGVSVLITYDGVAGLPVNAGDYPVLVMINDPNYQGEPVSNTLTITPRPITVTAGTQTKIYGYDDPALTYAITDGSLVEGDSFSGALTRDQGEDVGDYVITQGSLTAGDNYDLMFVGATLSITPRPITVTADPQTKVYGNTDPALTYQITSGSLAFSDNFGGVLSRDSGEGVGTYAITQGSLVLSTNYALNYLGADLTITSRPVTVTADAQTKVYGNADPALTYRITSGSLAFTDQFTGGLNRDTGENVGSYAINQNTLALSSNYTLTYVGATLTITPRPITVTADAQSKVYSEPDPELTYQITSGKLVTGDSFTGALSRAPGEGAGTYAIQQNTLALSSNYTLTYVGAYLTIEKETATLSYTGDTQVTTAKAGAFATVTLAVTLEEEQDGSLGDQLAGKQILFQVYDFNADPNTATPKASCPPVSIGNVADGKGYGSCTVSLGAADPYTVKISLVDNDFYTAEVENVVILVNDPGTGMAVGGGWVVDPTTNKRTSFGFTTKFLKNGKVQGNSLFIYQVWTDLSKLVPGAPAGERAYNWIIKSNAMQSLYIYNCPTGAKSGCKATITGKNNIKAVDRLTGISYSLGGNYQFQVDVTDNREPGSPSSLAADQYAIRVWNAGGVYYMLGAAYDPNGKLLGPLAIRGGNIQVKPK